MSHHLIPLERTISDTTRPPPRVHFPTRKRQDSWSHVVDPYCRVQWAIGPFQDSRNDSSWSHDIHLFPSNNPRLYTEFATGTAVACQKNTTADRFANSCHRNNSEHCQWRSTLHCCISGPLKPALHRRCPNAAAYQWALRHSLHRSLVRWIGWHTKVCFVRLFNVYGQESVIIEVVCMCENRCMHIVCKN